MKIHLFCLLLFSAFITACQSPESEKRVIKDAPVFLAVRIWGEELQETVNILVQVQNEEQKLASLRLRQGESVLVDSIELQADSARYSGVFYEARIPAAGFGGEHRISFTTTDGRTHSDIFQFSPFTLANEPGAEIAPTDLVLQLDNFPSGEKEVNLLMTDTAYVTNDINTLIKVNEGRLVIDRTMLSGLRKGPVFMQIIMEDQKLLRLGRNRGKLLLSYSLQREFLLR